MHKLIYLELKIKKINLINLNSEQVLSFLKSLITIRPSNEDYEIEKTTKTEISSSIEKPISISNEEEVNVDELVQEVIQQELEKDHSQQS